MQMTLSLLLTPWKSVSVEEGMEMKGLGENAGKTKTMISGAPALTYYRAR